MPGVEVKRNYPHIFFESVKILLKEKRMLRKGESEIVEKTVVRPEYSRLRKPKTDGPPAPDAGGISKNI